MKTSLLIGMFFVWGIAHFICLTIQGDTTGADMGTWYSFFYVPWAEMNLLTQILTVVLVPFTLVVSIFKMLLFLDYGTIFQGDYVWFRTLILWPISGAIMYGIFMNMRGASSS